MKGEGFVNVLNAALLGPEGASKCSPNLCFRPGVQCKQAEK